MPLFAKVGTNFRSVLPKTAVTNEGHFPKVNESATRLQSLAMDYFAAGPHAILAKEKFAGSYARHHRIDIGQTQVTQFREHHRGTQTRPCVRYDSILIAVCLIFLSGCATTSGDKKQPPAPTPRPSPVIAVPSPQKPPRKAMRDEPREAKEPERVAAINPKSLIGLAPAAVQKILGTPTTIVKSDPSLVWTYAGQGCSFQIVFYPDLKTEDFHALKYGSSAGDDNSCIRNILTVKSNGPS